MAPPSEMERRRSGGIPASALSPGDPAAAAIKPSMLAQARHKIARGEIVHLYPYGEVWMQILGTEKMEEIEAATFSRMGALGLPPSDLHVGTYNLHRFRRVLAEAVRCPGNHEEPFGTLEDWGKEPDEVLAIGVALYKGVKARIDPVTDPNLTDDQARAILDSFKKKDFHQLASFGSGLLATWLLSGAVQLSSSPTPSLKSSESSPE